MSFSTSSALPRFVCLGLATVIGLATLPGAALAANAIVKVATPLYSAAKDPSIIWQTVPAGIAVTVTSCPAGSSRCFIERLGRDGFVDKSALETLDLGKPIGICAPGKTC